MKVIEWEEGYPTEESLDNLNAILQGKDYERGDKAFWDALKENMYSDITGPTKVEVRGELSDVWQYHTAGWSGNESIIYTLQRSIYWGLYFQRQDAGGHYYFKLTREAVAAHEQLRDEIIDAKVEKITNAIKNLERDPQTVVFESAVYLDKQRENREHVKESHNLKEAVLNALDMYFQYKSVSCIVSYYSEFMGEDITLFDFENLPGECIWVDTSAQLGYEQEGGGRYE